MEGIGRMQRTRSASRIKEVGKGETKGQTEPISEKGNPYIVWCERKGIKKGGGPWVEEEGGKGDYGTVRPRTFQSSRPGQGEKGGQKVKSFISGRVWPAAAAEQEKGKRKEGFGRRGGKG